MQVDLRVCLVRVPAGKTMQSLCVRDDVEQASGAAIDDERWLGLATACRRGDYFAPRES